MTEGAAYVMTANLGPMQMGWWTPQRGTNLLDGGAHFYNTYETADGGYVTFGGIEPPFYADMLKGLGLDGEDLPDQLDEAQWPAMRQKVAERVRTRTRDEWVAVFADLDACFAPVLAAIGGAPSSAPRGPGCLHRGGGAHAGGAGAASLAHAGAGVPAGEPPRPAHHRDARRVGFRRGGAGRSSGTRRGAAERRRVIEREWKGRPWCSVS